MKLSQRWASAVRDALVPADTDARDRFAFVLLLAFIVFVPWFGSASLPAAVAGTPVPVGRLLVPALACAIGVLAFSSRSSFRSPRSLGLFLASIGLEILGLGVIEANTLGITLYWVSYYSALLHGMWWWFLPPVIIIIMLFVGLFAISAGLDDLANPRKRRTV